MCNHFDKIRIIGRRWLCLLLVLAVCAAIMPASYASGEPSGETTAPTAGPEASAPPEEAPAAEEEPAEALPVPAFDGASNEEQTYAFLTGTMGFNAAAACGIMANIWCESRFDPNVTGDGSSSFGICQWHDWGTNEGRYTNLKNFCAGHGYDYHTLEGQLYFLKYELETSWYGLAYIRNKMYTFPDTPQGAYDAGYYWCKEFGRPADSNENPRRGVLSRDTFYPRYSGYTAVEYTVSFDACGGSAVGSVTVTSGGTPSVLPASIRTGYTFGGWYSGKNGGGTRLTTGTAITQDTVWYARWDANRYAVSFDVGAGVSAPEAMLVSYGSAYGTLPMPGKAGYRFDGWFNSPTIGDRVTADTIVTTDANHTLYAHWTAFQTFTVRYDANGGTGTPLPQEKLIDADLIVTATRPRRAGYSFLGWAESPDANTAQYAPGGVYKANSDTVLYAVWERLGGGTLPDAAAALRRGSPYEAAVILKSAVGR